MADCTTWKNIFSLRLDSLDAPNAWFEGDTFENARKALKTRFAAMSLADAPTHIETTPGEASDVPKPVAVPLHRSDRQAGYIPKLVVQLLLCQFCLPYHTAFWLYAQGWVPSMYWDNLGRLLLRTCGIYHYDVLIIGDGSGGQWDNACGWSGVLIDRATGNRRLLGGHANAGSITYAESQPFIQGMMWYDHFYGEKLNRDRVGLCDVHVITDNQSVADIGNQAVRAKRESRAMLYLTTFIATYMKLKYGFTFHWLPRNEFKLTEFVDRLSKQHRITAQTVKPVIHSVPKS